MAATRPGLLLVWTDIPARLEPGFNEWYNRNHIRERILDCPGFVRGRRFVAYQGGPRYLAIYEASSTAALFSEPYLALKRNYDPESRRYVPEFHNTLKGVGEVTARAGVAEGGVIAFVPLAREPGRAGALRAWVADTLLPEIQRAPGVIAVWFAERDEAALASALSDHPRATDRYLDAALVVEAMDDAALAAAASLWSPGRLQDQGAAPDGAPACLRTVYTVHRPAA